MSYCNHCGEMLNENDQFCSKCGRKRNDFSGTAYSQYNEDDYFCEVPDHWLRQFCYHFLLSALWVRLLFMLPWQTVPKARATGRPVKMQRLPATG